MSLGHGLSIPKNGLVFQYDMGNDKKSWKGAPATNVVTHTNLDTGWSQGYNTSIQWNDYPAPSGIKSQVVSFIDQDGNGSGYWYSYGDFAPQDPDTTYCISIYARTVGADWTIRAYTADNSELGRQYTNSLTVPGDGKWYRLEFNPITTPSNTQSDSLSFNFTDIPAGQRCWLCAPQMTATSFHVPFVEGTRSNTQALIDTSSQNNTITASSLTYNSNNTFSFNGTSDWATAANINLGLDPFVTVSAWIKRTNTLSNGGYWGLGGGVSNNGINGYTNASRPNKIGWDLWGQTTFDTGVDYPLNEWVHVVWVKNASGFSTSTLKVYINGVDTALSFTSRNNSSSVSLVDGFTFGRISDNVGGYYAPGEIDQLLLYDVALSSTEISRIFESTRGRYGV